MLIQNDDTIKITGSALSQIYYNEQSEYTSIIPKEIKSQRDIQKIRIEKHDKIKAADQLYNKIKKEFLNNLDENIENIITNFESYQHKIIEYLSGDTSKTEIKKTIKQFQKTSRKIKPILLYYNKFKWFKDPNLLSTIRFHERLNELFLERSGISLEMTYPKGKLQKGVEQLKTNPEYLKAVVVVTLFTVYAYGALYAATRDDYEYILKYESLISEIAHTLFSNDIQLQHEFFDRILT